MESKAAPCCEESLIHTGTVEKVRAQLPPDEQLYDLAELFKTPCWSRSCACATSPS